MKIENEFTVSQPIETVWRFFQDVPSVADCLPGAELTEDRGDHTYAGKVSVKLGPMAANFEGEATVTPDEASRSGTIDGKGADRRGGSRGQVKVEYQLTEAEPGTKVSIVADVMLSGAAAQFGRTGLISEMSNRLIGDFVACVEGKLSAETPEAAADVKAADVRGFSLFLESLIAWIRRLFGRR
ncbi:MAG TPA: SRPBCC family protein [Acidimicrobiia bacterium]|nr:SRPBCC family protein [Acidimicrobiia bacterium]